MEFDNIDFLILQLLTENSRIQWKDLGQQIHLTGQAVGRRIRKLEDNGIIKAYSIIIDEMKLGLAYTGFLIINMKEANHNSFLRYIDKRNEVVEAHRISGGGCYHLKIKVTSQENLNLFLEQILYYGNYTLSISVQEVKQRNPLSAKLL
ncbi:HTH-type transcriptional regulator LrpB [Paenibacillus albidus]|uniref:HTH-type transcriptional regulator LrpB n=1 Tax=Paenibacillus albidus TaxID=2041023 RepID=A0A917C3P1_9BACL|nr:Lrp/AsnC family transcriptional regulator [Paenibacillus albidus]GGF70383.1 HTH-type transcriptional regulator LrpB [Paenibacillus albidus]